LADQEHNRQDGASIDELLRELADLRDLDRRRQAHRPGSAAYDAATLEVDRRSRRLMDRFRDLQQRREGTPVVRSIEDTRQVSAHRLVERNGGSRLH
jgi:hypothetical protein